jgi:hypothetical protein
MVFFPCFCGIFPKFEEKNPMFLWENPRFFHPGKIPGFREEFQEVHPKNLGKIPVFPKKHGKTTHKFVVKILSFFLL